MWKTIVSISLGAVSGALLRWQLGVRLNALFPSMPPGTFAANLIGAYIVGIAISFFSTAASLSPEWKLFIITGFCGSLTTFSTFSAEVVSLIQEGDVSTALAAVAAHVVGSLLMTLAGIWTHQLLQHA